MTVVHLKARRKTVSDDMTALAAVDQALGAELVRLGRRYGAYTVTTVAMRYVADAVERARLKQRPTEDAWLRDLARCFNEAMKGR